MSRNVNAPANDSIRGSEIALWTGAGAFVLAVHVGAAAWMLAATPQAVLAEAPAAIMIDLAPMPEAQEVEENLDLPPDDPMIEQAAAEPVEAPEEEPEEIVEPEPEPEPEPVEEPLEEEPPPEPEEVVEPEPDPEPVPDVEEPPPVEKVEVPLPRIRPPPPPRREPRPQRRQQAATPAPRTTAPPRVEQAAPSRRTAAPETARGVTTRQVSPARWQSRLLAHLERHKRYPSGARNRREQGTAQLRFSIDASGRVTGASIVRSSGFPELDQAVMDMVRRASPVPAPPPGVPNTFTVPVRFNVR